MKEFIGFKGSLAVYVDKLAIAQKGLKKIRSEFGMIPLFPVKTSPHHTIMVEAETQEEAIRLYFRSKNIKVNQEKV